MNDSNIDFSLFVANIDNLSAKANISRNKALIESGVGKDFVTNMINKKQVPSLLKVVQLAQYFNVSIDYLLGYNPDKQSDGKTEKLLAFASKLTEEQIDALIEMSSKFLDT